MSQLARFTDFRVVAATAVLGLAAAVAAAVGLSALTKPDDFKARLDVLTARREQLAKLASKPGDPNAYAPTAVCPDVSATQAQALELRLRAAAATAGVSPVNIAVGLLPSPDLEVALAPITFNLVVEGPYDAALMMMDSLSRSQPEIFIDTADLKSKISSVDLTLSGRIYCWTSARG
jgi:hypothetical protein